MEEVEGRRKIESRGKVDV